MTKLIWYLCPLKVQVRTLPTWIYVKSFYSIKYIENLDRICLKFVLRADKVLGLKELPRYVAEYDYIGHQITDLDAVSLLTVLLMGYCTISLLYNKIPLQCFDP